MPKKSSKRSNESTQQPPLTRQKTPSLAQNLPKSESIELQQQAVYVKVSDGKKQLNEIIRLRQQLQAMEKEIYDMETNYLESAPPFNAIRGYESLLVRGIQNQKMLAKNDERLISASSVTGRAHISQ
eukprot:TRINITY_DN3909_c0_g1_i5.p5 TRINITY_DN3909_c0_g1~~TRINITY_DN3909_c0_g1_i5.p5  ORF type:complete len:127 (+),score=11.93 TRINITY_DN3909_c0_g1_i5:1811-2191(+)